MSEPLHLGEPADEAAWRALVAQGLKGAKWDRLVGKTSDGIALEPLYRETDVATSKDTSGFPGAAPFVRGARQGAWLIRQAYAHPDAQKANAAILSDLAGGVGAIELVIDPKGEHGVAITNAAALDIVLANVILEAAPVSLDAGAFGLQAAQLLAAKLRGVAAAGTAFNLDPIGALMRDGEIGAGDIAAAAQFAARVRKELPAATAIRIDARPVHDAGGTEAQEIAAALSSAIAYLRALKEAGLAIEDSAATLAFAIGIGPDVLIESAKLRALRLCWARVLEASGAAPAKRAAYIHAFTGVRMLTRQDAQTNILRITTAAFGAAIGGADVLTTSNFTDALGGPTPFARRVARNTQHVLLEECRLGHVADPAGGSWFVEKLTRDLADKAWALMQEIEAQGGMLAAFQSGSLQNAIAEARTARQRAIATRRETITGVTDFPLLGGKAPEVDPSDRRLPAGKPSAANALAPIRWAEPFERLCDRAAAAKPRVFFANLATLAEFGPRAQFSRNLLAVGGVSSIGPEDAYASIDTLIDAFSASGAKVALITGRDADYADHTENAAQRLKAAGAVWVALAGKPGEHEAKWRRAGVDQFVFVGQDVVKELETLHAALGIAQ
jgi:methylmalonyl-CoA mutase